MAQNQGEDGCGCHFGVPSQMLRQRRNDKQTFYCPSGHPQCYRESDADRLRRELAAKQAQLDQAHAGAKHLREQRDEMERSLIATKGVVTKLKKKSKKGECPCCEATFVNLAAHIRDEHPEYLAEPEEAE